MKQLEEIAKFIKKCQTSYFLLLQLMEMKHESTDVKVNTFSIDNEGSHSDHENFRCDEGSQFQCAKCNKTFYLKKHLLFHIKGHSEMRPYTCPDCGIGFKYRQNLLQHKLSHNNIRLYKCNICGKSK